MRIISTKISLQHLFLALIAVIGLLFLLVSIPQAEAAAESSEHIIIIHDRGEKKGIYTSADTLGDAISESDVVLDERDRVEPGLDTKLVSNNYQVNVYRARPVVIADGATNQRVMTAHQTPKAIAKDAGIVLQDEDNTTLSLTNDLITDGASERLTIDRATAVNLVLYGKKERVYTQAKTVDEFMKEKSINLDKKDTLSVKKSAAIKSKMKIEIWRNGKQTVTENKSVDFPVRQIQDADKDSGYKKVKSAGVKGKKAVTYQITMKNGKEIKRKVIKTVVLKKPTEQVEIVGTRGLYTGGPLSNAQINALGSCESGMDPAKNTGNGFYGAFQFTPSTWTSTTGGQYSYAHQAPLDYQKQAVQKLLSGSNIYNQFPGCAKKMKASGIL